MPLRKLSVKQLKKFSLLASIFGFLSVLFFDQSLSQLVSTERHPAFYRPIRELTQAAEGKYYFALIVVLILVSGAAILINKIKPLSETLINKMKTLFSWSKFAFYSMLCGGIILQFLKHIVGRQRPHASPDLDAHIFDFFTFNWHHHSFPSGHTQTVFTFATILWLTFPKINRYFFFIPAVLAMTRLPLEEHFLSDVIAGALLGFFATIWVAHKQERVTLT